MLLQHQQEICDIEQSIYQNDEIFQMVVKNLSPEVVFNANKELIQAFTQTVVNYSPISVNIIDYWNKNNDLYSALYKPTAEIELPEEFVPVIPCFSFFDSEDTIHKGFGNFAAYAKDIPTDQPTGIDPLTITQPSLDEEGNPILDVNGEPIIETIPNAGVFGLCSLYENYEELTDDCGFYLNNMIGLQDKLAEIFMHNVYSIADNAKHNHVFRERLTSTLRKVGVEDAEILKNINDLFTEDRFIINGTWREKKGTEVAMRYAAQQAYDSNLQPHQIQNKFKWDIITVDPMTYTIEGSILPSIFEVFIRPLSHPISYIYEYKMVCEIEIEDHVMVKKIEYAEGISVVTLCTSNLGPCCNPLNELDELDEDGEYIHPYPNNPEYRGQDGRPPYLNEEIFECARDSQGQYGRQFIVAVSDQCDIEECTAGVATGDCELWDKLDCEEGLRDYPNVLLSTESGIVIEGKYTGYAYMKYTMQNLNYLVKYSKQADLSSAADVVIEYWRNGPYGFYAYAIWYNDWQADINIVGYKYWYETELSDDEFEALSHPGRADTDNPEDAARWFGFEDDPTETTAEYPLLVDDLVPLDWIYYGITPPGTDPAEECPEEPMMCNINFGNKGFGNFALTAHIDVDVDIPGLDPEYIAGCLLNHPVNIRCQDL